MAIRFVNGEAGVQGTPQWKEFRKWKIGSSSAASIRGVGFKTPLQLFEQFMEETETPVNAGMIRGTLLEPTARAWLNEKYQSDLQPAVVQHPNSSHDWHISSLDGIWQRPDGSYFVCEIKCPGREDHSKALNGEVPEKYLPQLYHILEDLPGVDRILYLSYREDSQAEVWIERDEHLMHHQFAEELAFYSKLISCTTPEPMEKDWIRFSSLDLLCQANEYSFLQDEIEELQEKAAKIKQEILEKICFTSRAKIGHTRIQKVIRRGAIDYSKIEALKGIDLEEYRKDPIITWRVSI